MMMNASSLQVWGGIECTVNRVGQTWFSQLQRNGHWSRLSDLDRIAKLGIRTLRYPLLWELAAPSSPDDIDWSWPDGRLHRLRELGITPVLGLVHHGSGPRYTSLVDDGFAAALAKYAGRVAARYPWVEWYTPVNEPLTTARFSGLYGLWYPHGREDRTFVRALLNQCSGIVLSMQAIRQINPDAKLVQTEDFGTTRATRALQYQADFDNHRRWISWDILSGRVDQQHPLRGYLLASGATDRELDWFCENACPPQVMGVNHYVTSDRFLDERLTRYPRSCWGGNARQQYADLDAVRVVSTPLGSWGEILRQVWTRYQVPIAITEVHLGCTREEQMRWFLEAWLAAQSARMEGCDVRAVTAWALLGSFDWNTLLTRSENHYEPGAFDVTGPLPRQTALGDLLQELIQKDASAHPALVSPGWWNRPQRLLYESTATDATAEGPCVIEPQRSVHRPLKSAARPLLICGSGGMLGQAFAHACSQRGLAFRAHTREELDICDSKAVDAALDELRPWGIINAAGYTRLGEAEQESQCGHRVNVGGLRTLAGAANRRQLPLLAFSSDLVFDGRASTPYVESSSVAPICQYGRINAAAEVALFAMHPEALCARVGSLFGGEDRWCSLTRALRNLADGRGVSALHDVIVSPTYVPDVVSASLDLIVDRSQGLWHLANPGSISWLEFIQRAARMAGISTDGLSGYALDDIPGGGPRPRYSALNSEKGKLMAGLDTALERYCNSCRCNS